MKSRLLVLIAGASCLECLGGTDAHGVPGGVSGSERNRLASRVPVEKETIGLQTVRIPSTKDGSLQILRFWPSPSKEKRPLLVVLHTWSLDAFGHAGYDKVSENWCRQNDWSYLVPNFRGPNKTPQSCCSEYAIQDVLDAVDWARKQTNVDQERIYLLGGSGGGLMSLMLAARKPDLWAGVSTWCPIFDLELWYGETRKLGLGYWRDLEKVCGGTPEQCGEDYRRRSPRTVLGLAKGRVTVNISTGIHDGRHGSVPVGHAIRAFNSLADDVDVLSEEVIAEIERTESVPGDLRPSIPADSLYPGRKVHFQRRSNQVSLTLFEGGHDIFYGSAVAWLAAQRRDTRPIWNISSSVNGQPVELSK